MRQSLATATFLLSSLASLVSGESLQARSDYASTCKEIEQAISSVSALSWPGESSWHKRYTCSVADPEHSGLDLNPSYDKDIGHWASSSSAQAACSVEPATAEDVGKIVRPDRKSTRLNSSHSGESRMPSSA